MKTIKTLIIVLIILLHISVVNAQINKNIKLVANRAVKIVEWQGKEIQIISGEIAIKIDPSTTSAEIDQLLKIVDGELIIPFDDLGWGLIKLSSGKDEISSINQLSGQKFVKSIEPNGVMHANLDVNDPFYQGTFPATYAYQWALKNTGQTPPTGTNNADIEINKAWDITQGSSNVVIAILDSGIPMVDGELSHPDLDDANKIIIGNDRINDGNSIKDEYGHGTHVAGIAAAESNNSDGIAGVAYKCKILVEQVFDEYNNGTMDSFYWGVKDAVNFQISNPDKKVVINYSGSGGITGQQIIDAVAYAYNNDVPLIASVGNNQGGSVRYPALYSSSYSNIIAVSSTDATDTFSSFSNKGPEVCVSAPGGYGPTWNMNEQQFNSSSVLGKNIFSTTPGYTFNAQIDPSYENDPYTCDIDNSYGYWAGTSMSAPHVTGIAALVYSINSSITAPQLRKVIQNSADKVSGMDGNNFTDEYGYGRVNAYEALKYTIEHYGGTIGGSGQTIIFHEDITLSDSASLTIASGTTVNFDSGRRLYVDGNLTANGVTFTSSGTWTGIKYNSGSTGSLTNCTISNATNGVFLNGSNRTISNCTITNCAKGIRCSNCISPALESNAISGGDYGIYNYNSDPKIVDNTISSGTSGIFNYNSSPNIGDNEITGTGTSIYCDNFSSPNMATLEGSSASNYCHANSYIGVGIFAAGNSHPVLGATECGGNYGNNIFDYSSCFAFAYAEDGCSIYAPHNWWGSSSPLASMFFEDGGDITYEPYLTSVPSSMPGLSPEDNLYDTRMMLASAGTDSDSSSVEDGSLDLTQYYNDQWDLSTKIEFIRYLYTIGEANGVVDLCEDIITEYPYQTGAFTALDMIYQISKNDKIKKDFDKDMLKTYLKTFEDAKGNEFIKASAMLLLAGLDKDVALMDKVYKKHKDTYMGKHALHQKFMYYFNEEENLELARTILNEMDEVYPNESVTYESHVLMGDDVMDPAEFYSQYCKTETTEELMATTDISEILPDQYTLSPAVPNPFNPSTTIEFALPVQSDVKCNIYNIRGNLVKEYNYQQNAGTHRIVWDASNVSSGIYLIRFIAEASDGSETFVDYQKVTLLK